MLECLKEESYASTVCLVRRRPVIIAINLLIEEGSFGFLFGLSAGWPFLVPTDIPLL